MSGEIGCLLCSTELTQENTFSVSRKSFKAFLPKLFKYLLIPQAFHGDLSKLCRRKMFCSSCGHTIQEVISLQKKITELELQIQMNIETMGNSVVAAISALDPKSVININQTWPDQIQELYRKFRYPIIENFAKGLLPSSCVQMEKGPVVTTTLANLCEIASNSGKVKRTKTEPIDTHNVPIKLQVLPAQKMPPPPIPPKEDSHQISAEIASSRKKVKRIKTERIDTDNEQIKLEVLSPEEITDTPAEDNHQVSAEIASSRKKVIRIKTEPFETNNEPIELEVLIPEEMSTDTTEENSHQIRTSCNAFMEDKEGSKEATRTIDCPSCDFQVPYGPLVNRSSEGARMNVDHHFTRIHNLTESDDYRKDESTGQEFYPCSFCEFSAFVKPIKTNQSYSAGKQRWYALLKYSRHLMKFHADEFSFKARAELKLSGVDTNDTDVLLRKRKRKLRESTLRLNQQPDIKDGRFYFKCPIANCGFSYSSTPQGSTRSRSLKGQEDQSDLSSTNKIRYGLRKIGDHVITIHKSSKAKLRDPYEVYIKRKAGNRVLACPWAKCDCVIPVTESVGRSHNLGSYNTFAQHYGHHLFNECGD